MKVLLVDCTPEEQGKLQKLLSEAGYDVEFAQSSELSSHSGLVERTSPDFSVFADRREDQALFDGQLDAFLIADTSTLRFLDANPSICSMLGYTKKELLRMSVTDIHPAKSADAIRDAFTSTLHLKTPATELVQFLRKDGSIFSGLITAFTIQYSGRLCLIGFVRENSQRHSKWATPAEVFKTFVSQSAYGFVDFDV